MRNSPLPFILLLVVIGCSLWLIRGGGERGAGGPAVYPGILKLPEKQRKMTASAELSATNATDGLAPADAASWRVVVVAADDNEPLTRAVLLALGEQLTRRGCLAVLEPRTRDAYEPVPLGADGILRVTTKAEALPAGHPGELTFAARIEAIPVRLPADHPALRWFPELPPSGPTLLTIRHRSTPIGAPGWPVWFAGVGRSVADTAIDLLGTPKETTDTTERLQRMAWSEPGVPESEARFGRIPSPPQGDVVERLAPFQQPFVRGWIGTLSPVPVKTRDGGTRSAREELVRRLERGSWAAAGDGRWTKDDHLADGTEIHRSISIDGEALVEWQERPKPASVWEAWVAAGDQAQLARHRGTVGIPASLRTPSP